jgi:hypothetical protein
LVLVEALGLRTMYMGQAIIARVRAKEYSRYFTREVCGEVLADTLTGC